MNILFNRRRGIVAPLFLELPVEAAIEESLRAVGAQKYERDKHFKRRRCFASRYDYVTDRHKAKHMPYSMREKLMGEEGGRPVSEKKRRKEEAKKLHYNPRVVQTVTIEELEDINTPALIALRNEVAKQQATPTNVIPGGRTWGNGVKNNHKIKTSG